MNTCGRQLLVLVFLVALVGQALAGQPEENLVVAVEQQDTLGDICGQYLKDPRQCPKIAQLNGITNPDLIHPGQLLKVPAGLLSGVPVEGTVLFAKGETMMLTKEDPLWQPLHVQDKVPQGATIRTGPGSALEVGFADNSSLLLRADTIVGVAKSSRPGISRQIYEFFLSAGRVLSKVTAATGKKTRYKVRTPSAVAATRGTDFRTGLEPGEITRVEVLQGKVGVLARQKEILVQEGEGTLVSKDKVPLPPQKLLAPPEPRGLQPLYQEPTLRLELAPVAGAVRYRIMLGRDQELKDVVKDVVAAVGEQPVIRDIEDGSYFLQTQSIDRLGLEGPASTPYPLTVRSNPLPPFIQSPGDGEQVRQGAVSFRWLSVAEAVGYHLQLARDKEFQTLIEDRQGLTENEHTPAELPPETYYFHLRSMAKDGYEGMWSDPIGFTVIPPPPSPPVEPPEAQGQEMRIRWRDMGPGITYHFQMAREAGFSGPLLADQRLERPEVTIPRPDEPGTYYVRTSAINTDGYEGKFSAPQNFAVPKRFPYGKIGLFLAIALGLLLHP